MMTSYAAPQLLENLKLRGFREPMYEDLGYILTHDCCGKDFWYTDWTPPETVDHETLLHTLSCREMR